MSAPRPKNPPRDLASTPPATSSSGFVGRLRETWPARKSLITTALFGSLTLGLAPFVPHPHVWKQLVNIYYGRFNQPIDQFDLLLHGAPWVFLIVLLAGWLRAAAKKG